jgi:hypothetical protein
VGGPPSRYLAATLRATLGPRRHSFEEGDLSTQVDAIEPPDCSARMQLALGEIELIR